MRSVRGRTNQQKRLSERIKCGLKKQKKKKESYNNPIFEKNQTPKNGISHLFACGVNPKLNESNVGKEDETKKTTGISSSSRVSITSATRNISILPKVILNS